MKLLSEHRFLQGPLQLRMHQLDNGLRVLLLADPSASVIAYQTWFRVGSRDEKIGKTGIAHLFEHLMFNQTKHLAPGQFDRTIETQGGSTNAATWVDWTYYQVDVPASELPLITQLEAERMRHLVLQKEPLESEREVVLNERRFRVEDDIQGFMQEDLFRLAFQTHPYHWPTIGWMNDIRAIQVEDAQAFYRAYYAPNNATIVIVGDFVEETALKLVSDHYGSMEAQPLPPKHFPVEPQQTEARRARHTKPIETERMVVGYKGPSFDHPDHVACQLLTEILCGGPSSRLYRDLVIDTEMASSVHAYVTPFQDPGLIEIQVVMQRNRTCQEAEDCIERHIKDLQTKGPSIDELERAKARLQTGFLLGLRTVRGKAESLGEYETTGGDYRRLFQDAEAMQKCHAQSVQTAAHRYLQADQSTTVVAVPDQTG